MNRLVLTILVCLGILGITFGIIIALKTFAPVAKKKERVEVIPVVEVVAAGEVGAAIELTSEGLISARRETVITSELSGRIVFVDPRFQVGGVFEEGDVIVRLDEVNYIAAVAQAEATVADAELTVKQEVARSEQARRDWGKIGRGRTASEMVLRIPFLKSAEARLVSAKALLGKARKDLERTCVRAPFDCRVRQKALDLGATVSAGGRIGEVYDSSVFEVRLPFTLSDYPLIPEGGVISLSDGTYTWSAMIVRGEGDLDRATLSAYVVAEVQENNENPTTFKTPLPGMFVKATVHEVLLPDVIAVPRAALRGRDQVTILTQDSTLDFRTLKISRTTPEAVFASSGIETGEHIILTRLEVPVKGMKLARAVKKQQENPASE